MKTSHLLALSGLLLTSTASLAGPYLGASAAYTNINTDGLKNAVGGTLSAGYQLDNAPLFVEAEYYNGGKFDIDGSSGDAKVHGVLGFVGLAMNATDQLSFLLKGGYYSVRGKANGSSEKYDNFALGAGIEYMASPELGIRAEVENAVFKHDADIQVFKLGLIWRPGNRQGGLEVNPASLPYSPPAPNLRATAPAVAPAAAAAPAVTLATVFKPGDEALARPGSMLRATPQDSAEVVQHLSPSPLLKLESSIYNATGTWWFVSTDIERGWLRAEALVKP